MARENSEGRSSNGHANGVTGRLKQEAGGLLNAVADRALSAASSKVHDATGRLTDYVEGDGGPGLMAAMTGAKSMAEGKGPVRSALSASFSGIKEKVSGMFGGGGKGKGGGKRKLKLTNIVEAIDVGVPVRVAYNQWTQFPDFPTFTKKVDSVDKGGDDDTKVNWKAQVFWSHRSWEATILDQRPDERIVWRSKGQKGHVDGSVTFAELAPNLTRIVVVLEYHPQGMFERTGNLWRAQGRRTRLELKHFARHVMMNSALHPDEIEGWRGVIEDSEVVKDHETAMQEESEQGGEQGDEEARAQAGEEERPEGEKLPEDEAEDEAGDEEAPEDEEEAPDEGAEEPAAEDEDAEEEEQDSRRRRPAPARAARGRRPASAQPQRRAQSATRRRD